MKHGSGDVTDSEPSREWSEQDDVIYFSVTSDGTTGKEWIKRLKSKNFRVSYYAKRLLSSSDFKPTYGVTTQVAVLKGMLFSDNDRITKNILSDADKRKLIKPNAEIACLIREKFTDEEIEAMGLSGIVVMYELIKSSGDAPGMLSAYLYEGGRWLDAYYDLYDGRWNREDGFAFASSQFQHST